MIIKNNSDLDHRCNDISSIVDSDQTIISSCKIKKPPQFDENLSDVFFMMEPFKRGVCLQFMW